MMNFNLRHFIFFFVFLLPITVSCQHIKAPTFDGQRAFEQLKKQCDFGPRVPGTKAHLQCRDYLTKTLRSFGAQVTLQPFPVKFRGLKTPTTAYNIIANFHPQKTRRLLLCAHWDSRPWADQDPNPQNHNKPVMGASDGASGVAVLLEIARLISIQTPKYGVDIVFFDAEDFGSYGNNESWALGSRQFAQNLTPRYKPEFGILLDLIGDADQQLYIEKNSYDYAKNIVDRVWNTAAELGIAEFVPQVQYDVYDDHLNLLTAGIKCIDIIDFDYQYWHTVDDTPDKCSPQSLKNVGDVLRAILYK